MKVGLLTLALFFSLQQAAAQSDQLAIPTFDVRDRCYHFTRHSAESDTGNANQEHDFADCLSQEQKSLEQLRAEWPKASYVQRRRCIDQDRTHTYFMFEQCVRYGF